MVNRPEKQHAQERSVCPGCQRCTSAFIIESLGLLQAVRGSTRLWRRAAIVRGAFCAYRLVCWLLAFYQVWRYEPCEPPEGWWSGMLGSVSAGSAGLHFFLAYGAHRMKRPTTCELAWTAAAGSW